LISALESIPLNVPKHSDPRYGWVVVAVLSITQTVGFGVLFFSFSIFVTPMELDLGWSRVDITGAYSFGLLIGGIFAVMLGRWADHYGAHWLMTIGSLAVAALLMCWSAIESVIGFYALWIALGIASEMVLYPMAFLLIVRWFSARRSEAMTVLTFIAGFAGIIFSPLTGWLVEYFGWREALFILSLIVLLIPFPLHAFVLRDPPHKKAASALPAQPVVPSNDVTAAEAFRRRDFWWLTLSYAAGTFTISALGVHLVPLLIESDYAPTVAAGIAGAIGIMALPGRVIFTPLGARISRHAIVAFLFITQAVGVLVLGLTQSALGVWIFVFLYGIGFGAITPARASLVAETYGSAHYGAIAGRLSMIPAVVRSVSPVLVSALAGAMGGYAPTMWLLAAISALSAFAVMQARREGRDPAAGVSTAQA
jgi:MFS family permease